TAAILGGASGMLYQAIIEMQDAYSADWGFSWGDIGSNIAGSALYVLQETGLKEQRMQIKMSYWPEKYEGALRTRSHHLFGTSAAERVLKDYNSQTYWISLNLASFFPDTKLPPWLNVAVGYGAEGLHGAR